MQDSLCPYPWTSLYLNYDGEISPCCFHYPIANIREGKSFEDIWNGKELVELRDRWAFGNLKGTPCLKCPGWLSNKGYDYPIRHVAKGEYLKNITRNLLELNSEATVLKSMPVEVLYVPSTWCNYDCIHCCQQRYDGTEKTFIPTVLLLKFYHIFGKRAVRHMFSGGEPLGIKDTYKILDTMPIEQKESSELVMLTNGSLIKKTWEKLEGFSCYQFEISIASFSPMLYEKIHRGVKYNIFVDNFNFLVKQKLQHNIRIVRIIALMKSNFVSISSIVDSSKLLKIDDTWILPVHASDGKLDILKHENIFTLPYMLQENWESVITEAKEELKNNNIQTTFNHLEYIETLLPKRYYFLVSLKNLMIWYCRVAVLKLSQSPSIRRFIKKIKTRWL